MSIEVMKQWLECVERCDAIDGVYSWSGVVDSLRKATAEAAQVRPEQAEQQEPVAWIFNANGHTRFALSEPPDDAYDEGTLYSLYTAPPQRQPQ